MEEFSRDPRKCSLVPTTIAKTMQDYVAPDFYLFGITSGNA